MQHKGQTATHMFPHSTEKQPASPQSTQLAIKQPTLFPITLPNQVTPVSECYRDRVHIKYFALAL